MGLLPLGDFRHSLVCPRCRSPLLDGPHGYLCGNASCEYAHGDAFPVVAGRPVLVDFERSLLTRAVVVNTATASVVPRRPQGTWKQRVRDFILGTNPVARARAERFRTLLRQSSPRPAVLVVGGGTVGSGAESLYEDRELGLIGFDVYGSNQVQFIADGHSIPLRDGSVDGVWVQAVLEHVLDPWQVVAEIHRVLKPDGLVYAETPFMQQVHEGPFDFTRFTESGHRWLFRYFTALDSGAVQGPGTQMLWSIDHLARSLFRSRRAGHVAKLLFFWLRFLDRVCSARFAIDDASCCSFLGRRAEQAMSPKEVVGWYKGAQYAGS